MSDPVKKVVIIAYTFPPTAGIGGRRWAKFAKYLTRKNIETKVIAAKNQTNSISNWNNDITNLNDKTSYINPGFTKHLIITHPTTIKEKILYRLAKFYAMKTQKGNYYDKSGQWVDKVIPLIEQEIENGCKNIIVTCAPFIHAFHISELKLKYPEINYIIDFRDPWVTNRTAYGFASLSKERQEFEINAEYLSISRADVILTVANEMTNYFKNLPTAKPETKFITIPNGFDKDDFIDSVATKTHPDKLKFILTGTLYEKSLHILEELVDSLSLLKKSNLEVYNKLEFNFYGSVPGPFLSLTKTQDCIQFKGQVSLKEAYNQIGNSDLCMLFLTDDLTFSFSTKFYEYIANDKPIAVFSNQGKTAEFIEQNKIGYALTPNSMKDKLIEIYGQYKNGNLITTNHFNISQYDADLLTEKIIALLK